MSLRVPCPNCGLRPTSEFTFGGEVRQIDAATAEEDFARVYLAENPAGPQFERWYHAYGCKAWFTVTRDTTTNRVG